MRPPVEDPMLEVPMLEKLAAIEAKYSQIEARLAAPETYDDPAAVARLNKEQNELSPVVETYRSYLAARERLAQAEELLSDPEMREAGSGGAAPDQRGAGAAGGTASAPAPAQGPQ